MSNSNFDQSSFSNLDACLKERQEEYSIFATDSLALPSRIQFLKVDPLLYLKCARGLVLARDGDVVLLSAPTDQGYVKWLGEVGFGASTVISFESQDTEKPLSELIRDNPEYVLSRIGNRSGSAVYIPFYGSKNDIEASKALKARFFGCDESITQRYFDKASFKQLCKELGLPTVGDGHHSSTANSLTKEELADVVYALLGTYKALILRGVDGSGGDSVFRIESGNVSSVLQEIRKNHSPKFLVEPFLRVVASPNDQWCILSDGTLKRIGLSAQLFKGLSHVGNLFGEFFSKRVVDTILSYSEIIGRHMSREGYRGIFGVDYIVAEDEIFPIENNARMNGSSFAFSVMGRARELSSPSRCWKFFKAVTEVAPFTSLKEKLNLLLFAPGKRNSVFPLDCDGLRHTGVFACLLLAEDLYHLEFLEAALLDLGIKKV